MPMVMVPSIQAGKEPGKDEVKQTTVFLVVQGQCLACGTILNFSHVPKDAVAPAPEKGIDSAEIAKETK